MYLLFLQTFHTTFVIRSNRNKVSLPFNANMSFARSKNSDNEQVFTEAANHTADQLPSSWPQFAQSVLTNDSCFSPQWDSSHDSSFPSRQDSSYPESEYSRQRADAALKLGGREQRGKERIL